MDYSQKISDAEGNTVPDEFRNEPQFNIKDFIFKYILAHWYLYIISLVFTFVAAYYYIWVTPPIYSATSTVLINKQGKTDATAILNYQNFSDEDRNIQNQMLLFRSRSLLVKTLKDVNFDVSYTRDNVKARELYRNCPFEISDDSLKVLAYSTPVNIKIVNDSKFEFVFASPKTNKKILEQHRFGEHFTNAIGSFVVDKNDNFNNTLFNDSHYDLRNFIVCFNSMETLIGKYANSISVNLANKDASALLLTVQDNVPDKAIDFLNKLVEVWLQSNIDEKNEITRSSLLFIDEQLSLISRDLSEAEGNYEKFRSTKGIVSISSEGQIYLNDAATYQHSINNINLKLSLLSSLETYVKEGKNLEKINPALMGIEDVQLQNILSQLSQLYLERDKLALNATDVNPAIMQNSSAIESTKASLIETIRNIKNVILAEQNNAYTSLRRIEDKIRALPGTEREAINIQRQVELNTGLYTFLSQKRAETAIVLASTTSDNRVIDKAVASYQPIYPKKNQSYVIAVILGFLLPSSFVYLRHALNDKITDKTVLENNTKIPLLGIVGVKRTDIELVVKDNPRAQITESFRSIRTNLQYFVKDQRKCNTILITSSVSSEGKSFCALNLAGIIALSGKKTVLLGFDLRKPKSPEQFHLKSEIGISNYLGSIATIDEIIQETDLINLNFILSGPKPPNPAELMMSEKADELFNYLKAKFDYILIDSPPIGLISDALVLTKYADSTVYVVRQNVTRKGHLEMINSLYRDGKLKNLSILFNAVQIGGFSYGYGYGYGYGYYDDDKKSIGFNIIDTFKKRKV